MNSADLIEQRAIEQARASFWAFRQFMNPNMKRGWFQRDIARKLQRFWNDFLAGKRPKLIIMSPPQHGKSETVVEFVAWAVGQQPELKTIYGSFSKRLGVRANKKIQRMIDTEKYKKVFPHTRIDEHATTVLKGKKIRSTEFLEFAGSDGSFRNTTVNGSVTGESLDLGVIDDPLRGRADANSQLKRDKAWDWLTDDFLSRFSEFAALLMILTSWHLDDPARRFIIKFPDTQVLVYPALAESGAKLMPDDPRTPGSGDALFPEFKSREFLLEQRKASSSASWESLYQQNPIALGGEIIKGAYFGRYTILPKLKYRKIYGDTAQKTKEANDYSVFECWGLGEDGWAYLIDLIRGKWEAPELKRRAVDFWTKHKAMDGALGVLREMGIEDKASGTGLIQDIRTSVSPAIPIKAIQRNIDKLTRVMDVLSYIEAGYVHIPETAAWVSDFVSECESFTSDDSHAHDDQIDPMCDAISNLLARKPKGFFDV